MSLSTSNSNKDIQFSFKQPFRRLLRPLLVCLFLLALYQSLVLGGVVPASDGINQRQGNQIKAERYIYNTGDPQIVLVGSSKTAVLLEKYFDSTPVTNISMSASSSQTGLKLVELKNKKPDVLLVELNYTLTIQPDYESIEPVQNPVLNLIKTGFPIFREEYKPVSVFVDTLKKESEERDEENTDSPLDFVPNQELRKKIISDRIEKLQVSLPPEEKQEIQEQSAVIKQEIIRLQERGIRVILFDLPVEPQVANTPQRNQETALIREMFPEERFEWLPQPPTEDWITFEGVHLVPPHAKKFAVFIQEQLLASKNSKITGM
ncbi:hypothetical protein [Laspinema olomoucense]|uniref:hypothetical protein n=1 Tax=Laspinema olomoucense TaxID=3231600 RepID=UPI0021BA9943|nr:hypothetical protein [Laspinema sp. D3a]MCT7989260.1 hypothetical protein [Laspinema sp. D3a]